MLESFNPDWPLQTEGGGTVVAPNEVRIELRVWAAKADHQKEFWAELLHLYDKNRQPQR